MTNDRERQAIEVSVEYLTSITPTADEYREELTRLVSRVRPAAGEPEGRLFTPAEVRRLIARLWVYAVDLDGPNEDAEAWMNRHLPLVPSAPAAGEPEYEQCYQCGGAGQIDEWECATCEGTGKVPAAPAPAQPEMDAPDPTGRCYSCGEPCDDCTRDRERAAFEARLHREQEGT